MTIETVPAQAEPTTPTNRGTAAPDGLLDPTPLAAGLLGSLLRHGHDAAAGVLRWGVGAQAFDSPRALMYTRENLVWLYKCGHGELGRLLKARLAPLPIRIDGQILWYVDEALNAQAQVERTLKRWRDR